MIIPSMSCINLVHPEPMHFSSRTVLVMSCISKSLLDIQPMIFSFSRQPSPLLLDFPSEDNDMVYSNEPSGSGTSIGTSDRHAHTTVAHVETEDLLPPRLRHSKNRQTDNEDGKAKLTREGNTVYFLHLSQSLTESALYDVIIGLGFKPHASVTIYKALLE